MSVSTTNTAVELKALIEDLYYVQRKSLKNVAKELQLSSNRLNKLFEEYGLQKKAPPVVTRKQLEDLYYTQRMPVKPLADHLGISTASLYKLFEEHGIKRRPNSAKSKSGIDLSSPNVVALLRSSYCEECLSYQSIGERLGISASKVYSLLKENNLITGRGSVQRKLKENISKNELIRMYSLEKKSLREISELCKTSSRKIKKLLTHYEICENPKLLKKVYLQVEKERLVELYVAQNLTATETARLLDISVHTLRQALAYYGLEAKPVPSKNRGLDRREIERLYIDENMSLTTLATKYSMSYITMARFLKKQGIRKMPIRAVDTSQDSADTEGAPAVEKE